MNTSLTANRQSLDEAVQHLSRDEIAPAESIVTGVLNSQPHDFNALQLLGTVRSMQNRPAEAEQLYLRSLSLNRNQPMTLMNLGHLLWRQLRLPDAANCFRQACELQPSNKAAHLYLGGVLHQAGMLQDSEASYRAVLRLDPADPDAKLGLAAVLNEQKKYAQAEELLANLDGKRQEPEFLGALEHNLGIARNGQNDPAGALVHYARALTHMPDNDAFEYSRGSALRALGREDQAVETFRRAVALNPLNLDAHRDLNHLLYRLNRDDEFLESYDAAALKVPQASQLTIAKANFLLHAQRNEEALEILERARAQRGDSLQILQNIAIGNMNLGRFSTAIAAFEKGLAQAPDNIALLTGMAATLLRARDGRKAAMMAEHVLARAPHDQTALAIMGTAWRLLNDEREFGLNSYETFIRAYDLEPPEGYSDMDAFNRDLNAYLDGLHPDAREYIEQSLRHGTQTVGSIFDGAHDLVDRLRLRIEEVIARYIRDIGEDAKHPLLSRRASSFAFSGSWSSRLRDCGYHTNHIHPQGWISSAYYIALPDMVSTAQDKSGWIKFGEPCYELGFSDPVRRVIAPKPGRLVLFPSYMWHGTVPFRSGQSRTTIAFDAVPR